MYWFVLNVWIKLTIDNIFKELMVINGLFEISKAYTTSY